MPATMLKDEVVAEIEIAAPPERVFAALTDPKQLAAWFGEQGRRTEWRLDLRVGGRWSSRGWDESCGQWTLEGEILHLDRPRSLSYSWRENVERERAVPQTTVRYDLEPTPKGTRLRVTHSGFGERRDGADRYRGGWVAQLEALRRFAESPAV